MDMARQMGAVALVLGLLAAVLWLARRGAAAGSLNPRRTWNAEWLRTLRSNPATPKSPAKSLERLGRLSLTPHHTLHLVRIQGLELIVATHPQGCSVVTTAAPPASTREASASA